MTTPDIEHALAARADCEATVERLHKLCCEPGRSPRLLAVEEELTALRATLAAVEWEPDRIDTVIARLEDIGASIGRLQVGCCTPARMPLYDDVLTGLTTIQIDLNRVRGTAH